MNYQVACTDSLVTNFFLCKRKTILATVSPQSGRAVSKTGNNFVFVSHL